MSNIKTWQERRVDFAARKDRGTWLDEECMEEEITDLRAALVKAKAERDSYKAEAFAAHKAASLALDERDAALATIESRDQRIEVLAVRLVEANAKLAALAAQEPVAWIVETESSRLGHYCDLELFTDEKALRDYCSLPYIKPKSIKQLTAIPVGGRYRELPFDEKPGEWTCTSLSYALERMSVSESRENSPRRIKGYEVEFLYLAAGAAPVQEDYRIILDGNMWFASGPGFIDLHESKGGFGSTPVGALNDLVADPKLTCDSCVYLTEPCDIGPCSTCARTGDFRDNHTLAPKEPS